MPFVATDYEKLKTTFMHQLRIYMLQPELKESEERDNQINFIQHIITQLDAGLERAATSGKQSAKRAAQQVLAAEVLFAALNIVFDHLKRTTKVYSLLKEGIGEVLASVTIPAPTQPPTEQPPMPISHEQLWDSYKKFNPFILGSIYLDQNPQRGYNPENPIQGAPGTDRKKTVSLLVLKDYIVKGLDEELLSLSAFLDGFKPEDVKTFDGRSIVQRKEGATPTNETPFTTASPQANFTQLKEKISDLIDKECAKHKVTKLENLSSANRKNQLQFLQAAANSLENTPELAYNDKVSILAGLMHIIRMQINAEYRLDDFYPEAIAGGLLQSGSFVQTELTNMLLPSSAQSPSQPRKLPMGAIEYVCSLAVSYVAAVFRDPAYQRNFNFPTSDYIKSILNTAQSAVTQCRKMAFDTAIVAYTEIAREEARIAARAASDAKKVSDAPTSGVVASAISHMWFGPGAKASEDIAAKKDSSQAPSTLPTGL